MLRTSGAPSRMMVKPRPRPLKDEQQRKRPRLPRGTLNISKRWVNEQIAKVLVVIAIETEPALQRLCIDAEPFARSHLGTAELL